MKAPHPVFLAATRLDGLGQALLAEQPVAVSGLALSEIAAVMYAAATEIRELQTQVRDAAQAQVGQVMVPRDALEGVLGCHSETDNDSGDEQCLSCYVILAAPRRTGVIYQDHAPDCDTVILRAALAQAQAGAGAGQGEGA